MAYNNYVFRWFCYYQKLLICQTLELQNQENFQGVSTLLTERKEQKSTQNMISSKQIERTSSKGKKIFWGNRKSVIPNSSRVASWASVAWVIFTKSLFPAATYLPH